MVRHGSSSILRGSTASAGTRGSRSPTGSKIITLGFSNMKQRPDAKRQFPLIPKVVRLVADRLESTGVVQHECRVSLMTISEVSDMGEGNWILLRCPTGQTFGPDRDGHRFLHASEGAGSSPIGDGSGGGTLRQFLREGTPWRSLTATTGK